MDHVGWWSPELNRAPNRAERPLTRFFLDKDCVRSGAWLVFYDSQKARFVGLSFMLKGQFPVSKTFFCESSRNEIFWQMWFARLVRVVLLEVPPHYTFANNKVSLIRCMFSNCSMQMRKNAGSRKASHDFPTSRLIFVILCCCNIACLSCPILKLQVKCAIKRTLTVTYSILQETKVFVYQVYLKKAQCVFLCFSNLICAYR